jgi:hypothetical protein
LWPWGVSATLHPARVTTLPTEVPGVRIGCRTRAVSHPWLGHGRPVLHRLRPPLVANHGRPRQSPHTVVHVWCSERTISCAVKGRTRTPAVSRRRKRRRSRSWRRSAPVSGSVRYRHGIPTVALTSACLQPAQLLGMSPAPHQVVTLYAAVEVPACQ